MILDMREPEAQRESHDGQLDELDLLSQLASLRSQGAGKGPAEISARVVDTGLRTSDLARRRQ
jgi:hypothetical protein